TPYRGSWISAVRGPGRWYGSIANNPAAATAKNPIVNLEAATAPTTTLAPERVPERRRYSRSDQEWEAAEALAAILRPDDSVKRDAEALPFVRPFLTQPHPPSRPPASPHP